MYVSGQGSATQSTVRQIGSALGTAVAGATLAVSLAITLPGSLASAGFTGAQVDRLAEATRVSAGTVMAQLRSQGPAGPLGEQTPALVDALTQGFASAVSWVLLVAALFLVLGLAGAWQVKRQSK